MFAENWISNTLGKYVEPIVSKLASFAKDEWEKFKIDSNIAFSKYLKNSYEKYSKVKTILYRTEPKFIYDFFEYPNLRKRRGEVVNSQDINELLNISNYLIVQGTGGIGKSTFMKHLFISELSKEDLIPIFVELKDLNELDKDYEISDFVFEKLYNLGCDFNREYLEYALQAGCFLFLLDGYDEIVANKKNSFLKKITDFSDRYVNNYYIISSRPYSEFVEFQRFSVLTIDNFTKKQAVSLIKKIEYDDDIKTRFVKDLNDTLYNKHKSFASNPLLLNIMLLTYDNYAEIPEKLHLFYANAFETLYSKHDATKGGYKRELTTKLSFDAFKKVFSYFCFITYYHGKVEFSYEELIAFFKKVKINNIDFEIENIINDLVNSICVLYKDGLNYKFAHRSFQEYFTAIFLKELPDKEMGRMGLQLIKKDEYRATHDHTFKMLYDMSDERVEQNILLPMVQSVENDCAINKYDFYLEKANLIFLFEHSINNHELRLVMRVDTSQTPLIEFIRRFSFYYYVKNSKEERERMERAEKELYDYLAEECGYVIGGEICGLEYRDNKIVYDLIKKTWIGKKIETMATFCDILTQKQKESELDLTDLLVE